MSVRKIALCAAGISFGFCGTALADAKLLVFEPNHDETIKIGRGSLDQKGNLVGEHDDVQSNPNGFIRSKKGKFTTVGPSNYRPVGMNDRDMTTGNIGVDAYITNPDGSFVQFDVQSEGVDGIFTDAMQINDKGFVAGMWWGSGTSQHGFVRDADGNITSFDAPDVYPGNGTTVMALSSKGSVAGYFTDTSRVDHGFVRSPSGKFKIIDVPGGQGFYATHVYCINAKGAVGGDFEDDTGEYGFVMNAKGHATKFTFTNANFVTVNAINARGDVTGDYHDNHTGHDVGFIRTAAGETTTFEVPNANETSVGSINDKGEVAGTYVDGSEIGGFLRKP